MALATAFAALPGCLGADIRRDRAALLDEVGAAESAAAPARPGTMEPDLSGPLTLQAVHRVARRRNPDARAALARARAAAEAVPGATALPDLRVGIEHEAVPLRRPLDLRSAGSTMFGVRQMLPFPGVLRARGEAALARGREALVSHEAALRALEAETAEAYWSYALARRELELHREHIRILDEVVQIAEVRYATGRGSQPALLQAQVEHVRLTADLFASERDIRRQTARLNALLGREPGEPLGPPEDPQVSPTLALDAARWRAALERNPEVRAATESVRAAEGMAGEANAEAWWPEAELGISYAQMPGGGDGWSGSLMFNLPWLSPARWARSREAEAEVEAMRRELEAARRRTAADLEEALARAQASQATVALFEREILPKARQSLEAARAAYAADREDFLAVLEAERSFRSAQLDHAATLAEHAMAVAAARRAAGEEAGGEAGERR